jgi:hypothetical protein
MVIEETRAVSAMRQFQAEVTARDPTALASRR